MSNRDPSADRPASDETRAAYTQLLAYIAQRDLADQDRLPTERALIPLLGVTRSALRNALALAEAEGRLWRHVGRGTFLGGKPAATPATAGTDLRRLTSPRDVIHARLTIEPALAYQAALNASSADLDRLRRCAASCRAADSWRKYENWDNLLHLAVAEATQNPILLRLFDELNTIRRTVVWGRDRGDQPAPRADHHSFAEHDEIVEAIAARDAAGAETAMRRHIEHVARKLLSRPAPDPR